MSSTARQITTLLGLADDDAAAKEELFRLVEERFRRIAMAQLGRERPGLTVQETMLIDDAFLQLVNGRGSVWIEREQFFCAAAKVMRRLLVDHARNKMARKRGSGSRPNSLDASSESLKAGSQDPAELVALNDAIESLEQRHPDVFRVFDLHYFAGYSLKLHFLKKNLSDEYL